MKIALLGDISLNGRYDISNDVNAISRVERLREILSDCDYVIANLESPLTSKKKTIACKGAYLRSDPKSVKMLKSIGITHVTLANNHIFDFGLKGAIETMTTLKENGIEFVGLNNKPCLIHKDNDKALLEGFCCYSANGIRYGQDKISIKKLSPKELDNFFETAKQLKALPIASVHFGVENVHYPSVEHINLFRKFAHSNDYILHGNHPHAIQGYEKFNHSYLYYALGDLCFDTVTQTSINKSAIQTDESRKSYIVKLSIEDNRCIDTDILTVSDLPDGIIKINNTFSKELKMYCSNLTLENADIVTLRKQELKENSEKAETRNLKFYLDRLNYKYIGAFLNGKLHAKKYKGIMKKYFDEV